MREDADFLADLVASAEPLHVVGIVRSTSDSGSSYGTLGYTTALTEYVIQRTEASDILRQQKSDPETDVFTGLPFPGTDAAEAVSETESGPTQAQLDLLAQTIAALPEMYQDQISALDTDQQLEILVGQGLLTQADYDALGDSGAPTVSSSTYDENLTALYDASLDQPSSISLYAASFDDKEAITQALDDYNDRMTQAGDDDQVIQYTDYVGLLMKSVTNIVSMVSYVLIAFVGISLVVSSIMIGVITLISVQERTKEIGILRAMGASKRDVSRVFNAETLIIGLAAGLMGIGITLLLNIPINAIIQHLAGVDHVAQLPLAGGVILVAISVILTVLAGLIPAKAAAKKDPVEALRTE
jgi:putative ABC transport system permease protein